MHASGLYPREVAVLSNMCRRQAKARQPLTAWCPTQRPQGQRKGYRLATERLAATLDKTLGSLMLETKQGHLAEPVPMCAHGGSQNNLTDLKANRRRTFLQAAYVFTQSTLVFFFFITPRKDLERPLNLLKHVLAFLPKAKSSRKQTRSQSEQLELCARQTVARQAAPLCPQSELAFLTMAETLARTTYRGPLEVKNPQPSIGPP